MDVHNEPNEPIERVTVLDPEELLKEFFTICLDSAAWLVTSHMLSNPCATDQDGKCVAHFSTQDCVIRRMKRYAGWE